MPSHLKCLNSTRTMQPGYEMHGTGSRRKRERGRQEKEGETTLIPHPDKGRGRGALRAEKPNDGVRRPVSSVTRKRICFSAGVGERKEKE